MSHIPGHVDPLPIHNNYGFGDGNYGNWHNTPIWNWNRSTDLNTPPNREFAISELDAGRTPTNWHTPISLRNEAADFYQGIQEHPLSHFLPVAGTAMHWDDMGALEKVFSTTMDAIDVATFGSGKLITAPIKAATKFATRNQPALTYLRGGALPTKGMPTGMWGGAPTNEWMFSPSVNHFTGEPELGISTFQGLKMPWGAGEGTPQYYMRPSELDYPSHDLPLTHPYFGKSRTNTYTTNPVKTQLNVYENRPIYDVGGNPLSTFGADNEALLDPATAYYKSLDDLTNPPPPIAEGWLQEQRDYLDKLWTEGGGHVNIFGKDMGGLPGTPWEVARAFRVPSLHTEIPDMGKIRNLELYMPNHPDRFTTVNPKTGRAEMFPGHRTDPSVTNPRTGQVYNLEEEFAKYDATGTVINPWMRLADNPYISGIRTIPATMPIRGAINEFRDTDPIPNDAVVRSVLGDAGMQAEMLGGIDW